MPREHVGDGNRELSQISWVEKKKNKAWVGPKHCTSGWWSWIKFPSVKNEWIKKKLPTSTNSFDKNIIIVISSSWVVTKTHKIDGRTNLLTLKPFRPRKTPRLWHHHGRNSQTVHFRHLATWLQPSGACSVEIPLAHVQFFKPKKLLFPKIRETPQIMNFNGVFHYFHHPFWGVLPLFLETPK